MNPINPEKIFNPESLANALKTKKPTDTVSQQSIDDLDDNPLTTSRARWAGRAVKCALYYASYVVGSALAAPVLGPTGSFYAGVLASGAAKTGTDYVSYLLYTKPAIKEIKEANALKEKLDEQKSRQGRLKKSSDLQGLENFNKLPGLEKIKKQLENICNKVKVDQQRNQFGLKSHSNNNHMIFSGPPGTGKTKSAKALTELLYQNGVIRENKCIVADKSDFISHLAGYTPEKTKEVFDKASGGLLFIDEAYQLNQNQITTSGQNTSADAIAKLLTLLEERKDVIVIFAGYPKEMQQFRNINPGLASRIPTTIHFDDYNVDQLTDIFKHFCTESDYSITDDVYDHAKKIIARIKSAHKESFSNARTIRNFFERVINAQAARLNSEPIAIMITNGSNGEKTTLLWKNSHDTGVKSQLIGSRSEIETSDDNQNGADSGNSKSLRKKMFDTKTTFESELPEKIPRKDFFTSNQHSADKTNQSESQSDITDTDYISSINVSDLSIDREDLIAKYKAILVRDLDAVSLDELNPDEEAPDLSHMYT